MVLFSFSFSLSCTPINKEEPGKNDSDPDAVHPFNTTAELLLRIGPCSRTSGKRMVGNERLFTGRSQSGNLPVVD